MSEQPTSTRRGTRRPSKRHWVRGILLAVLIALAGTAAAAVMSGRYQVRPVLSGSMRPGLPVGGVVITKRIPLSDVQTRDVIVFTRPNDPSQLVVHRVISLTRTGSTVTAKTQGDANNAPDPWTLTLHGSTAYRAIYTVPLLGYPAVWMQNTGGSQLLLVAAGLAIITAMVTMWRKDRSKAASAQSEPAAHGDADAAATTAEHEVHDDAADAITANH